MIELPTKKPLIELPSKAHAAISPAIDDADVYADELPDHAAQLVIYETAGLSRPQAFDLEAHAAKIISIGRRSILEIGRELLVAREQATHGTWTPFLARCGLTESTARNYMHVAGRFADKPATVALLPVAALYAMAAPSADSAIVETIVRDVEAGARPTTHEVKQRLAPAAPPPPVEELPEPPALADMLKRLSAHGYDQVGAPHQKGMTTFYTFRDRANDLDEDSSGVLVMAEGALSIWLVELDDNARRAEERNAKYLDARERYAALGWRLERAKNAQFSLYKPTGEHYATAPIDVQIKTLATFEASAAKKTAQTTSTPAPRPSSATVATWEADERADTVLLADVARLLEQADQLIGMVKVSQWRAAPLEAALAEQRAHAFVLDWEDRLTRFSDAGMISQATFRQAIEHIRNGWGMKGVAPQLPTPNS